MAGLIVDKEKWENADIYPNMRDSLKNTLVILIVLAIALLPVRFGHAAGVDDHVVTSEDMVNHLDMHGCNLDDNAHAASDCGNYATDGSFADNCCDDQCSTHQTLLSSAFNLHFASSHSYDQTWSQWLPESIVVVEYRPPITLS